MTVENNNCCFSLSTKCVLLRANGTPDFLLLEHVELWRCTIAADRNKGINHSGTFTRNDKRIAESKCKKTSTNDVIYRGIPSSILEDIVEKITSSSVYNEMCIICIVLIIVQMLV